MNGWEKLQVWECSDDDCDGIWAQESTPECCPECSFLFYHMALVEKDSEKQTRMLEKLPVPQKMGFTYQEAVDQNNQFWWAEITGRIHVPEPIPYELVPLSTLPREKWLGMPVFHPFGQMGEIANWFRYDVGVVTEVFPDPDFAEYGDWRCRFVLGGLGDQGTLHYAPTNLWVPKPLAENLS